MNAAVAWREPTAHDVPPLGPTGSRVRTFNITTHNRDQRYRYEKKAPPTREVLVFDEDGDVIERRLRTDDEMAAITAAYEKHVAEFERTGGVFVQERAPDFTLDVECEDDTVAEADWCGDRWRWASYGPMPSPTSQPTPPTAPTR